MLKISGSTESTTRPGKGGVGVSVNGGGDGSSMDLSTNTTRIMVKYDEIDSGGGKSVKKLSKSRRIIKKPKKPQRPEKLKGHRFRRIFTEEPNLHQLDTKNLSFY